LTQEELTQEEIIMIELYYTYILKNQGGGLYLFARGW